MPKADPARYRDCLIPCWDMDHATCMELIADACDSIRSDELSACTNHCTELKTDCENGKGQYKLTERCDGRTACDDLSDEAGCEEPWVYCDDARQQLPSSAPARALHPCRSPPRGEG